MSKEEKVWGAVYIPSRAFNAYQMWRDYTPSEIERDLGYAESLSLNALRIWLSYEYWLEEPAAMQHKLEHFLHTAFAKGLRTMPSLFETCGVQPTPESKLDTNPLTAVSIASPSSEIIADRGQWEGPLSFVRWFMAAFQSDERLLAVEIMNEPNSPEQHGFARAILQEALRHKGTVALTVACIEVEDYVFYMDFSLDALQHHENFPPSAAHAAKRFEKVAKASSVLNKPVWVSEWQRIRSPQFGDTTDLAMEEWEPSYVELARVLKQYDVGGFFWSLMVKPAYLPRWRRKGVVNGLFHEDGMVWSLEDARAISDNPAFEATERRECPEWFAAARSASR